MALIHGADRNMVGGLIKETTTPPGVTIRKAGEEDMAPKAPYDGTYCTKNGDRFVIRAGDALPDGAVMDADPNAEPEHEERAKPKAPQNRSKGAAPENRAE